MALINEVTAPWFPSVPEVTAALPEIPELTLPEGTIVIFPEEMQALFGSSGSFGADFTGQVYALGANFSSNGSSTAVMYPIQVSEPGFSGEGAFTATLVQMYSIEAGFSGSGLSEAEREEFLGITGPFSGSGKTSFAVHPVIVGGFGGSGELAVGLAIDAGFGSVGSVQANVTQVYALMASFSGIGALDPTLVTFTPTEMDKSGNSALAARATVPNWVADTASYPGSIVSGNALQVVGGKVDATISASVNVNAFNAGHNVYLMHNGVQIDTAGGSFSTTYSLSATRTVANGDLITIEGQRSSGSATVQASNTWVRVT